MRTALPLLVLTLLGASCHRSGGDPSATGQAPDPPARIELSSDRVQTSPLRPGTLIAEHRFDRSRVDEGLFLMLEGGGATFMRPGKPAIPTFGQRAERGTSTVLAPVHALGGASALARTSMVGVSFYCPGQQGIHVAAVVLDDDRRELFRSEAAWLKRGPGLTSISFALPTIRPKGEAAYVGVEFSGSAGVRAVGGFWLTDPVPGSQLPAAATPEPYALGSDVREAGTLVEASPWVARISVSQQSYLRASIHVPPLYRGRRGELPRLALEVAGAGWVDRRSIPLPAANADGWHDVKLPLLGDRAAPSGDIDGDIELRLQVEDDEEGVTAVALVGEATVLTPIAEPRTVLLITSDTHRADYIGLYGGGGRVSTPALDALARRGAFFEDCQTTTNITTPSHVAIMTGLHPRDTAVVDNSTRLKDEAETLAERFREAGFRTFAAVSISHLTHSHSGLGQGFDRFLNPIEAEQRAIVVGDVLEEAQHAQR
ncbi:MAG: sulfatase-like hydrolase/transferase, partial [Planctomycetota bacterium]